MWYKEYLLMHAPTMPNRHYPGPTPTISVRPRIPYGPALAVELHVRLCFSPIEARCRASEGVEHSGLISSTCRKSYFQEPRWGSQACALRLNLEPMDITKRASPRIHHLTYMKDLVVGLKCFWKHLGDNEAQRLQ
jgi:hypothetical protein